MARDLPALRRRMLRDFRKRGLPREKVMAGIVRFLADGFFRVGNERYAKENHTFGITTLNKSHVRIEGDAIVFTYVGKRGITHKQTVVSHALARFVEESLRTPGRRLFRYFDGNEWHNVDARQVNDYLQEVAGFPYTAKDFRTWGGTLRAATVLAELGPARSKREATKNVVTAVRLVAAELGNTPAICRQSYVHPIIIEKYLDSGVTIQWDRNRAKRRSVAGAHSPEERALIGFLDRHFPERRHHRRPPSNFFNN
jgi:DNA topoisomerase-1